MARLLGGDAVYRRRLGWIAVIGLVIRVVYVLGAKREDHVWLDNAGDQRYYSIAAERLAHFRGFIDVRFPEAVTVPGADHPPLTAIAAAPASFLPGWSVVPQRLTMSIIGVVTILVIATLARELIGNRAGLASAALAAVHPGLWINDGQIMSESVGALTLAITLLLLYRWIRQPSIRGAALVGLACGFAVLARAEAVFLALVTIAPVMVFTAGPALRERVQQIAAASVATVLVLLPWVGPNLVRFEEPVLLSTNDGLTLVGANCDRMYDGEAIGLWSLQCAEEIDTVGLDQSEAAARYREAAFEHIADNRDRLPAVMLARVGRVWSLYRNDQMVWYNTGEGREAWASRLALAGYFVLWPLTIAGAVVLWRRRVPLWPLLSQFVNVTLTAALFYGLVRFRVGAEVVMVVMAGVALAVIWDALAPSSSASAERPRVEPVG